LYFFANHRKKMSKATKTNRSSNRTTVLPAQKKGSAAGKKDKVTFDDQFSALYGKDRWIMSLLPAMTSEPPKVALLNRYSKLDIEETVERKVKQLQGGGFLSQAALLRAAACGTAPERVADQNPVTEEKRNGSQQLDDGEDVENNNSEAKEKKVVPKAPEAKPWDNLPPLQEQRLTSGIRYVSATSTASAAGVKSGRIEFPSVKRDERGVPGCYLLDLASLLVVDALHVEPFHKVCDLCAAPGGKSCAIGQIVVAPGELVSNEPDGPRRARLQRVLQEYLGPNVPFKVAARDATTWYQPDYFDRVLVDAPCGSERHLIQQHATQTWSVEGANSRAKVQVSLLMRAFETVKVGGRVVYSTCSIHPNENDGVVFEALQKTRNKIIVDTNLFGTSNNNNTATENEESDYEITKQGEIQKCGGSLFLPDKCRGHGPMFICAFTRLEGKKDIDLTSDDEEDEEDD
jgi:5-methylcytosine rRNA methyltransferase NSUN4